LSIYLPTIYDIRAYSTKVKKKTMILVFGFIFTALELGQAEDAPFSSCSRDYPARIVTKIFSPACFVQTPGVTTDHP